MCGEKLCFFAHRMLIMGSPPHVRRKDDQSVADMIRQGITPACAGKRTPLHFDAVGRGDHPRMCGEKKEAERRRNTNIGSPPHVRGKVNGSFHFFILGGITPACAGKRFSVVAELGVRWDHPRMCGEKSKFGDCLQFYKGSPPHVRGKACDYHHTCIDNGITPACAGKSDRSHRSAGCP